MLISNIMAKDRFSKFKKSNYDTNFRYGNNSMNHNGVGKREKLNQQQRDWIINVIQNKKLNDWQVSFMRSILVENKVPTHKQKEVIKKIVK